LFFLQQLLDN